MTGHLEGCLSSIDDGNPADLQPPWRRCAGNSLDQGLARGEISDSRSATEHFAAHLGLRDIAAWWDALGQPDIAADHRAASDRNAAENRGAGIDHYVVLDDRVTRIAFDERTVFVHLKSFGPQRHTVVKTHVFADHGRFSDDDAGPVIDEEAPFDLAPGWMSMPVSECAISAMILATIVAPRPNSAWAKRW